MKRQAKKKRRVVRRGAVLVLSLIVLTAMFGFAALAIDLGWLLNARSEAHRCADAAALAACWEYNKQVYNGKSSDEATAGALSKAKKVASGNDVCSAPPDLADVDVRFGYVDVANRHDDFIPNVLPPNAVEITVRRSASLNGTVPTFFSRIFGITSQEIKSTATAAMLNTVNGFQTPADGSNLYILPFALDQESWDLLIAGDIGPVITDNWSWNKATQKIEPGPDGIYEVNLYPQGTGSPGNRGTVDIGSSNNSTADIARQILYGISPADLQYHGGKLEFDENGTLPLNGDTGISAGIKDELAQIGGKPRIIPVFSEVHGPGNNATYTIVAWVGVRIMEVDLTGSASSKRVIIQPAPVFSKGVIPGPNADSSEYVYSRAALVR